MADTAFPQPQQQQQQHAAAATAVAHQDQEQYIQPTPTWVVVVRGFQVFLSLVIVGMAGWLIHGAAMAPNGFAVVCGVFTWIVVAYVLVTEKVPSANGAYNIWAVLALDLLLAIFWLASLGANAALRASFTETVTVHGCFNDGSAISSNHCVVSRALSRRRVVSDDAGLAVMSAIAGLSALEWLLFIATLVFHGHTYRLWHQENKKPSADNATVEMKAQGTPMLAAQGVADPAHHPQYSDKQQYEPHVYPHQTQVHGYQPPQQPQQQQCQPAGYPPAQQHPAAYSQQTAPYPAPQQQPTSYQQPGAQPGAQPNAIYPDPTHAQYSQQPQQLPYSPHGTPAPGQPYYPPQQQ